jgi:hypothetical protein
VTINDNDINATNAEAILIDVRGDALTTSMNPANVRITNNRIGDDGMGGGTPSAENQEAIEIKLRDVSAGASGSKTMNLLMQGNFIENAPPSSSTRETVDIDVENFSGVTNTINATVVNNTFTSNGVPDNEFEITAEDSGSVVCLDLRNNTATEGGGPAGNGTFFLDNDHVSAVFNVNDDGSNVGTVNTDGPGMIGSVASCTLPP